MDGSFWTTRDNSGHLLAAWLNGATAYCSIWYDQSGAGNHATQTNTLLQPVVDFTNLMMDFTAQGGLVYFDLPSGTVPEQVPYTVIVKHGVINNPSGGWFGGGTTVTNECNNFRRSNGQYLNYWWSNDFLAGSYAPGNVVTFVYDGLSTEKCYINSAFVNMMYKASGWNGQPGNEYIGKTSFSGDGTFDGEIMFLYIFSSALSDSERVLFESGLSQPIGD